LHPIPILERLEKWYLQCRLNVNCTLTDSTYFRSRHWDNLENESLTFSEDAVQSKLDLDAMAAKMTFNQRSHSLCPLLYFHNETSLSCVHPSVCSNLIYVIWPKSNSRHIWKSAKQTNEFAAAGRRKSPLPALTVSSGFGLPARPAELGSWAAICSWKRWPTPTLWETSSS